MADWASISKTKGNQYGGGSSGAAGFQAWGGGPSGTPGSIETGVGKTVTPEERTRILRANLDALDKGRIGPGSVGVQAPKEMVALGTTPKVETNGGVQGTTNPWMVTQTASTGKFERPGDHDGSGYKNFELNPNVETDFQRTLGWA